MVGKKEIVLIMLHGKQEGVCLSRWSEMHY